MSDISLETLQYPAFPAIKYPNPYLDIASTKTPQTIKELFTLAEHNVYQTSQIAAALQKKASYPVTPLIYEGAVDDSVISAWRNILENVLDFPQIFKTINLNYYTYGNVFISLLLPIKKQTTCLMCNNTFEFTKAKYVIDREQFVLSQCPICGEARAKAKYEDIPIKDRSKLKLMIWNPNHIGIKYSIFTGKLIYFFDIPDRERAAISSMSLSTEELSEIPQTYLQAAISQNKDVVQFQDGQIFHMKAPSIAGIDPAWGFPVILSLNKDLYHLQTIKKANEAIMAGHMIPFKYLYPTTPPDSPIAYGGLTLSSVASYIQKELAKWKKDPNYISIMPIPLGQDQFGGQGRALLAQSEMNEMSRYILAGLGVPQEFLYGGLTWTGSNVSLRMLENEFMELRAYNKKLIDFIADKISKLFGISKISIRFKQFKMADDAVRIQHLMSLYQMGVVSLKTLASEIDLKWQEELEARQLEDKLLTSLRGRELKSKVKLDLEAQKEQQMGMFNLQTELQKKQLEAQQQMQGMYQQAIPQQQAAPIGQPPTQAEAINEQMTAENEPAAIPEAKPPRASNRQI